LSAAARAISLRGDDRQQVLAVPVRLRPAEPLDLDQIHDGLWPRLGNSDQCGVGEHALRRKLLVVCLLAPPFLEHDHRALIVGCWAPQVSAHLALGRLGQ